LTAAKLAWASLAGSLTLLAGGARAQDCEGAPTSTRLLIAVEGVRSDQGLMTASLYADNKRQFLVRNGALKVWRNRARAPTTDMCIWLPSPGVYAIAIYHDANASMKFDVGPFGPTEPYGFSNSPRILFSKPSLEAVRFFAHAGDNPIHVRLHNPP
jgi:uncharacterized protein (DUF2141 family)